MYRWDQLSYKISIYFSSKILWNNYFKNKSSVSAHSISSIQRQWRYCSISSNITFTLQSDDIDEKKQSSSRHKRHIDTEFRYSRARRKTIPCSNHWNQHIATKDNSTNFIIFIKLGKTSTSDWQDVIVSRIVQLVIGRRGQLSLLKDQIIDIGNFRRELFLWTVGHSRKAAEQETP